MEWLKKWWVLLVFGLTFVGETAVAQYRLAQAETDIKELEKKVAEQNETKEQLIRMEEQNKYTKEKVDEMRQDIKSLIRELKK